jgi:hypothetical protein
VEFDVEVAHLPYNKKCKHVVRNFFINIICESSKLSTSGTYAEKSHIHVSGICACIIKQSEVRSTKSDILKLLSTKSIKTRYVLI